AATSTICSGFRPERSAARAIRSRTRSIFSVMEDADRGMLHFVPNELLHANKLRSALKKQQQDYSYLSAIIGSTRDARRAGIYVDASATALSTITTVTNTPGSEVFTPYTSDAI